MTAPAKTAKAVPAKATPAAAGAADEGPEGLSGLDWVVIVAATLALVLLTVWLVQGQPMPKRPERDSDK